MTQKRLALVTSIEIEIIDLTVNTQIVNDPPCRALDVCAYVMCVVISGFEGSYGLVQK